MTAFDLVSAGIAALWGLVIGWLILRTTSDLRAIRQALERLSPPPPPLVEPEPSDEDQLATVEARIEWGFH